MKETSRAVSVVILFGLVSLFADIVYEGARSISGDYLEHLRAPAVAAGLVASGELLGYGFRLVSGLVSRKFRDERTLWALTVCGYAVQAILVPLLAFAWSWKAAAAIYIVERLGKGLRTPARDALLSEATKGVGRGLGFGIHEALDQLGAVLGPVAVGLAAASGGYSAAFLWLAFPGALSVALVFAAMKRYKSVPSRAGAQQRAPHKRASTHGGKAAQGRLVAYLVSVGLLLAGTLHWSPLSYLLSSQFALQTTRVAYLYALAMLADGVLAVPLGVMFDRLGVKTLLAAPLVSGLIPALLYFNEALAGKGAVLASLAFGVAICMTETVLRSSVPLFAKEEDLAFAYGLLGFVEGVFWTAGNLVVSYLYQLYGLSVQVIAFPACLLLVSSMLLASLAWERDAAHSHIVA